jgi:hypothetical protein
MDVALGDFVKSVQKALVPLGVAGLAVLLEAVGVSLPADQLEQVVAGVLTSFWVWLVPNDE